MPLQGASGKRSKGPLRIRVFMDITIGVKTAGRMVFELYNDVAPKAVENFRSLCTGEYGNSKLTGLPLCFRGSKFFKVVPGVLAQAGDFENNDGTGGESVFGGSFRDESYLRRHAQAGVLSMAGINGKRNCNTSQFLITLKRTPQLDGRHVAFGQLVQGIEVLRAIERCPLNSSQVPRAPIVIADCGEISGDQLPRRRKHDDVRQEINSLMSSLPSAQTESDPNSRFGPLRSIAESSPRTEAALKAAKSTVVLSPLTIEEPLTDGGARVSNECSASNASTTKDGPVDEEVDIDLLSLDDNDGPDETANQSDAASGDDASTSDNQSAAESQRHPEYFERLARLKASVEQSSRLNSREAIKEYQEISSSRAAPDGSRKRAANAAATAAELRRVLQGFQEVALPCGATSSRDGIDVERASSDDEAALCNSGRSDAVTRDAGAPKAVAASGDGKSKVSWDKFLHESADSIQFKDWVRNKKRRNEVDSFGWNALNVDSFFRAHKKRSAKLKFQPAEYANQILQYGEEFYNPTSVSSQSTKPSQEAKERLSQAVAEQNEKRKKFHRRRMFVEQEDVHYVNDFNRSFNLKLERAFGAEAREIRQNLERGTAL